LDQTHEYFKQAKIDDERRAKEMERFDHVQNSVADLDRKFEEFKQEYQKALNGLVANAFKGIAGS
jgi:hypothetical protein